METIEQAEKPAAVLQLDTARIALAEHERLDYVITVEQGTTRKDMINPLFWAHVAAKLRPYTELTIRCDDGTFYAKAVVTQAERTWARISILSWHDLTTRDVALSAKEPKTKDDAVDERYEVVQKGPHLKWCIIDKSVNPPTIIRDKESSKVEARTWLDQYIRTTT